MYVDATIAIDRDSDANGTLDERIYVLQDANFNVTALVNASGSVIERYLYDAYGKRTVLDANWATESRIRGHIDYSPAAVPAVRMPRLVAKCRVCLT
ncbi:MAG: hypothetical protein ACREIT_11330 [Tepidisphaeraceae bacterium]